MPAEAEDSSWFDFLAHNALTRHPAGQSNGRRMTPKIIATATSSLAQAGSPGPMAAPVPGRNGAIALRVGEHRPADFGLYLGDAPRGTSVWVSSGELIP